VVAVFKISSKYVGITRSLATRRILGIPKLLKCINKTLQDPERSRSHVKKTQLRSWSRSHAYENRELRSRSRFIFTRDPQPCSLHVSPCVLFSWTLAYSNIKQNMKRKAKPANCCEHSTFCKTSIGPFVVAISVFPFFFSIGENAHTPSIGLIVRPESLHQFTSVEPFIRRFISRWSFAFAFHTWNSIVKKIICANRLQKCEDVIKCG